MAGLISTGIAGFLTSAKFTGKQITNAAGKLMPECVSTFVSGFSGWMMTAKGDLECKSIYARDKIVTNEYVYNRIRVTEDEEIVSTNGKILSAIDNGDGTFTVNLDLREGDINGFSDGDLMQGYYHSPENSGVIYAVQRLTAQADPNSDNQSMIVTCEEGSTPYPYMIIVRVGNTKNEDRQAHIKISSHTNCQYFFDGIANWADMDDPDKVKCVLGKADIGLIPSWATSAVGSIKKWFGLIADGVILRGIFILKSSGKTIETELDGVNRTITDVETRFEVREGQISSKVEETKRYSENASGSASSASGSANAAASSAAASEAAKVISVEKASEAKQTADGFTQTVTETTKKAVDDAVAGADETIETKVATAVTQSAHEWKVEVMGSDAQGNPNSVIAAINATPDGIEIEGKKVKISGELLAEIIKATGLNINGKFIVDKDGNIIYSGSLQGVSGTFNSLELKEGTVVMSIDRQGFYIKDNGPEFTIRSTGMTYEISHSDKPLMFHFGNSGFGGVEGNMIFILKGIPSKNDLDEYGGVSGYENFVYEDNGYLKIGKINRGK